MEVTRQIICWWALLLVGCGVCCGDQTAKPIPLTMCDLFEHPEQYTGKLVEVRGTSNGYPIWLWDVPIHGSTKTCSGWLNVTTVFPREVSPPPDFDLVRDESLGKFENAINRHMGIIATYEGRFDILYVIRDGKRINLATGKQERRRAGRMSFFDARIIIRSVSDVVSLPVPRKR